MPAIPRRHEPWIDWLRALASLVVVFFHLNEVRGADDGYAVITAFGWLGVPVFFVVSGYCVMLSSIDRPPARAFVIQRYIRVLPPYWASLAIVLAAVVVRKLVSGNNDVTALPGDWVSLLATLTLTTKPVTDIPTINWVYWTLSYELAFYGIMALALVRRSLFPWIMLAVALASLVLLAYPLNTVPGLFFLDHWPLFACGVGLAEALHRRTPFGYALLIIAIGGVFAVEPRPAIIAGLLTAATIFLALRVPGAEARLRCRPALFLGTISYSLYLIHVPIGVYMFGHLVGLNATDTLPHKIAVDLLVVAGCIVFAYGFNRAVERPAQRLARALRGRTASSGALNPQSVTGGEP